MKKVTFFYIPGCRFCAQARRAIEQLRNEDQKYNAVEFDEINENEHPDIAENYDYQAVPCMFIGDKKIYEGHFGESYEECLGHVREVMNESISG